MNILICEDKLELVGSHITSLQKVFNPSTFDYAEDGQKAIEKVKSCGYSYDLILSDYDMPEATGLEVYNCAREQGLEVPFVLCSPSSKIPGAEEIKDEDEDFFCLAGPYDSSDLRKIVDSITADVCL